ncbi:MAG: Hsp70 family protein [Bdellovibrionaceae bacterium]|nr:Hsp70 family protein [Pseudobdellovibrionaceae bacterium]
MDKIVQIILKDCQEKYGIDLSQDKAAMKRITAAAGETHRALESKLKHEISLMFLGVYKRQGDSSPFHYIKEISRDEIFT